MPVLGAWAWSSHTLRANRHNFWIAAGLRAKQLCEKYLCVVALRCFHHTLHELIRQSGILHVGGTVQRTHAEVYIKRFPTNYLQAQHLKIFEAAPPRSSVETSTMGRHSSKGSSEPALVTSAVSRHHAAGLALEKTVTKQHPQKSGSCFRRREGPQVRMHKTQTLHIPHNTTPLSAFS